MKLTKKQKADKATWEGGRFQTAAQLVETAIGFLDDLTDVGDAAGVKELLARAAEACRLYGEMRGVPRQKEG